MNLSFIEGFYWVATLKSVSRAAKKLFIAQSAMSARIAVLEQELGVTLLDRRDRHVRLTPAGERFLRDAERLLELWRSARSELGGARVQGTTLRIGAIESVLHSWLIPWLEQIKAEKPALELELTIETTPVLLDLARRGTVDLIVASLPVAAERLRSRGLLPMPMVFVGSVRRHRRRRYALRALAAEGLLTFQRGSQPHVALLDLLRKADIEATRVHTVSSISALLRLVTGGFGAATLPRAAVEPRLAREGLRVLRCDATLPPLPLHMSWRVDPVSDVMDAVVESACEFAARAARTSHLKNR